MSIRMLIRKSYRPIVLLFAVSLLGSCALEDDGCKDIVTNTGEPDMTAAPVFAAADVAQGATVDVDISVDAETIGGTVYLLPVGSQDVIDEVATNAIVTVSAGAAETVTVTLTVDGAAAVGTYYPAVVLCNIADAVVCTIGAGYVEDITGLLADSGNYVRGTANGGSVDLSSLEDSCVTTPTINAI